MTRLGMREWSSRKLVEGKRPSISSFDSSPIIRAVMRNALHVPESLRWAASASSQTMQAQGMTSNQAELTKSNITLAIPLSKNDASTQNGIDRI